MKDLLSVHDYLFAQSDIGDWEGEEEFVTERYNELIHHAWECLDDDLSCERIDEIINGIWEQLRGDTALLDAEHEELMDWVEHYVDSAQDEQM
ncbi:hypothetical protein W04_2983 [Pseudoalteromonas sp. SW0106-04]|uniref:hypothetical protein n=1 Tax=Pseudoalteromonas sp. SW0106-04 TaxID=1702169 RepID=UPI0006B5A677|nr:hypothetical protein [Pseudoalteromonas sp. SW0106-04]GAP76434.1 hypothetical protein W04_2983 [Pseudoalteromonas sp. SW0106-04]